jgi:hypothetical protein
MDLKYMIYQMQFSGACLDSGSNKLTLKEETTQENLVTGIFDGTTINF